MSNSYFQFKEFLVRQDKSAMKVTTDACLFGGWVADLMTELNPRSVFDIGAGTGLLSLMIAQKSNASISAVEIDKDTFLECCENFGNSKWKDRLDCELIDVRKTKPDKLFDVIVSNPPYYVGHQLGQSEQKNKAQHAKSLNAEDLLEAASSCLHDDGRLYVIYPLIEFEWFREKARANDLNLIQRIEVFNEVGKGVFRVLGEFAFSSKSISEQKIVIRNHSGAYSPTFHELLREYYLYLD